MKVLFWRRWRHILLLGTLIIGADGCCRHPQSPTTRPSTVRGWKTWDERGLHLIGELVLKKGETSDNGRVGVKLIDIKEGKLACGLYDEPIEPEATLVFYRVSDPSITCEVTSRVAGRILDCDPRLELNTLGVFAINAREGWVYFNLG